MDSESLNQTLIAMLDLLHEEAIYLHRQHGWIIAVAETVEKHPDLVQHLKQHPFYDQGYRPDAYRIERLLQSIDGLIQRLKALS
jgi:hypothetical protein